MLSVRLLGVVGVVGLVGVLGRLGGWSGVQGRMSWDKPWSKNERPGYMDVPYIFLWLVERR